MTHRPVLRHLAAAAFVAVSAMLSGALAQQTQNPPAQQPSDGKRPAAAEPSVQSFQDWEVRCGRPEGQAREMCEMRQEQTTKEGNAIMGVAVAKVAGSTHPGMLILLPLGIALPEGVALKVDDGEPMQLPVQRCQRHGCEIELLLQPDLLAKLKAGREASVLFHVEQGNEVQTLAVPISLLGFTAALNEVLK